MAGSHVALGLAAWTLAAPRLGLPVARPGPMALAVAGALLPDIDHPRSWLGRRLPFLSRPIAAIAGHRGFTHSLLALALCCMALRARGLDRATVAPLATGYLSHLLADALTRSGLPLLWPWTRCFALRLCRTGRASEYLVLACLLAGTWALGRAGRG